ncbi:MAG: ammonia-forming cytochrome c nitrite reductase subunit c552, partial [Ignavibacteria bacterium]|nr:ammonia-forming cytochrome c nitrite reductase subunit c552 [Ignavibacteria bacterium]
MPKPVDKKYIILFFITAALTAGITLLLVNIFEKKQEATLYPSVFKPVNEFETDPAVWGENFPFEYDTYRKTEINEGPTYYGGSDPFQRLDKYPVLKILFAGMPFSVDYKEDRGHYWALTDVKETKRVSDKTPNTCITCKSSNVVENIQKMGPEAFYKGKFKDIG